MQEKFESRFDKLPKEIIEQKIARYLPLPALENAAKISRMQAATFFKAELDVRQFLQHVVNGEHGEVEKMLEENIDLLFTKGRVTDCSKRIFSHVSGFEYALWALDAHMWTTMLNCLPQDEKRKEILVRLSVQYEYLEKEGVSYYLNDQQFKEKHFDFENTIIKELQTQVGLITAPGRLGRDAVDKQWREGVGGAQKLLPMHVVHEYCSNEPFAPVPKFTSQPKSSKQFYNSTIEEEKEGDRDEDWFSFDSKLGTDFAIYKGASAWAGGYSKGRILPIARQRDLNAMAALCEVRTKDFINLKSQLEEQVTLDNYHQISQI